MPAPAFRTPVALTTLIGLATGSDPPPFAPVAGTDATPTIRAAFLIGVLAALGALFGFHRRTPPA
jgi:hypothetical protein